ncbi:MAG: alpha/beta hydrolase [Candidatus Aminicenantes bacterium]|nr:alpha/beta hydrolase [Candidatus Aminicenantes bacterium]
MKHVEQKTFSIVMFFVYLLMAGIVFFLPVLNGQEVSGDIEGIWRGLLTFPGGSLHIIFTINRNPDKILTAVMDVPEQNAANIPVDKISFENGILRIELVPIEGVFEGELSKDTQRINGNWTQGGTTLPLMLKRTTKKFEKKRPQEPVKPFPYKSEEVIIENKYAGIKLTGTLTLPSSGEPFPALMLLSGSGPQDRDEAVFGHRPFLVLADYLTRRGLAVLRVDDRGVGASTGDFDKSTAVDFMEDSLAGLAYLQSRKEIDRKAIGLFGHSEGGIISSMAAARSPEVAFIVLAASPGLPIREMEYSEEERALKKQDAGSDLITKYRALQDSLFKVIEDETDSRVVRERFAATMIKFFEGLDEDERKITGLSEDNLEGAIESQFQRLNSPWFRYYLPFDPGDVLKKVACPVMAVNGSKDVQVVSSENLPAIIKALEAGGNKDVFVRELPGLNHLFQTAVTGEISEYVEIEETISPSVMKMIADWILKHIGLRDENR